MSIRKAFAWLKAHGFVEKYNPNHYPKGHPRAGQFAPKDWAMGAGKDIVIHVPYRGSQVHQMLVRKGLAKPWKPKTKEVKKGQEVAKGFVKREGYIELVPPKPFKTMKEAKRWMQENLAEKVSIGTKRTLHEINDALAPIRRLKENGVEFPKVNKLEWNREISASGRYVIKDYHRAGIHISHEETVQIDKRTSGKNKEGSLEEKHTALVRSTRVAKQAYETHLAWAEKEKHGFTKKEIPELSQKLQEVTSNLTQLTQQGPSRFVGTNASQSYDSPAGGTLVHEFGHVWHWKNELRVGQGLDLYFAKEHPPKDITSTKYSTTDARECFAEGFALYACGEVNRIPRKMVEFFDKQFPQLAFGRKLRKDMR